MARLLMPICRLGFALLPVAPLGALEMRFGLKAGVPATVYFETGRSEGPGRSAEYSAATRRYTFGASAEWFLSRALGFGFDALYRRMGYVAIVSSSSPDGLSTSAFDVKGHSFDFPVRLKYRLKAPPRTFLTGGFVLRRLGPVRGRGEVVVEAPTSGLVRRSPLDTREPVELRQRSYTGVFAGAGVEFGRGRLRLAPEFRLTRWASNISGYPGLLRFAPNQAEFLVGLEF
jgi:hypothetical protein